ncbi:MAG: toll/interleukin-1 receptor domain-containing protein [Hyphomicrobium sp.]
MKLFISWSGEKSLHLAKILHQWVPNVIQSVEPFLSEEDIKKGTRWAEELAEKLEQSTFGIVCATHQSISSPWVLYEAGAISKIIDSSGLVSLLFGLEPGDLLHHPLGNFQNARLEKQEIYRLILSINERIEKGALEPQRLEPIFEKWWPDFASSLAAWKEPNPVQPTEAVGPTTNSISLEKLQTQVSDLVQLSQELGRSLASPERLLPAEYLRSIMPRTAASSSELRDSLRYIETLVRDLDSLLVATRLDSKQQFFVHKLTREMNFAIDEIMEFGKIHRKKRLRPHVWRENAKGSRSANRPTPSLMSGADLRPIADVVPSDKGESDPVV